MLEEAKKSLISTKVNRCIYCGSTSYGKGCKFGPQGIHFHPEDPKKCSYCGSTSYGKGCKFNPFNDIHMHGVEFNAMFKETLQKSMYNHFLLNELNKKIENFLAYKLGIIDNDGNKIKEPITEEEKASYSPATKTILKIKKYLGPKLDLINQTALLESSNKLNYNKDNHKQILMYEEKFNEIFKQLHEATNNALNDGLTLEQIETMIQ
jgi:hypothetical protein